MRENRCSIITRKVNKSPQRNRRASALLSPIFSLFLTPSGTLYLKVQHLLAVDELLQGSNSPHQKSTTKSNHPKYGIPADQWPAIVHPSRWILCWLEFIAILGTIEPISKVEQQVSRL